jgi:hypothetical protein
MKLVKFPIQRVNMQLYVSNPNVLIDFNFDKFKIGACSCIILSKIMHAQNLPSVVRSSVWLINFSAI